MPADKLGISDWISGQRYSPGKTIYLAVHNSLSNKVQKWGESECDKCQKLDFDGLPEKWHLFKISGINGDKGIKQDIPALSIDEKLRIKFENGIRTARGNKFFNFAPPKVSITGGIKQIPSLEYSTDNSKPKSLTPEENVFYLPKNIPCGDKITIKIPNNEKNVKRSLNNEKNVKRSLTLVENRLKQLSNYSDSSGMDCFGIQQIQKRKSNEISISENLYFKGAYCSNLKSANYPRLPDSAKRIYIVGNTPGQIIIWPQESWPEWNPVGMLQLKTRKKAIAYFIESAEEQSLSTNTKQDFSKEKIKIWKKFLWTNRKRIQVKPNLKKQWKILTEKAKNV